MPHSAKTIPDHKEKQYSPGSIMQHNAHPLSTMPEYYSVRVPLASPTVQRDVQLQLARISGAAALMTELRLNAA